MEFYMSILQFAYHKLEAGGNEKGFEAAEEGVCQDGHDNGEHITSARKVGKVVSSIRYFKMHHPIEVCNQVHCQSQSRHVLKTKCCCSTHIVTGY